MDTDAEVTVDEQTKGYHRAGGFVGALAAPIFYENDVGVIRLNVGSSLKRVSEARISGPIPETTSFKSMSRDILVYSAGADAGQHSSATIISLAAT